MKKYKINSSSGDDSDLNNYCNIKTNKVVKKEHHIYLTKEIKTPNHYINFLQLLETADEDEIIIIHINSPGGNVETTIQIIIAIKNCRAKVFTEISGVAYSAASMIFLAGHHYRIHNFSIMLGHYYSGCICGKGHEIKDQTIFDERYFESFYKTIYKNFMTPNEIKQMIDGKDFWFDSDEIQRRLELKIKAKNKK